MNVSDLFSKTEQFLRLLSPTLFLVVLICYDRGAIEFDGKIDISILLFLVIAVGPIVYYVYRQFSFFIDYKYFKHFYSTDDVEKKIANHIFIMNNKDPEKINGFLYNRFAGMHAVLLSAMLCVVYVLLFSSWTWPLWLILGTSVLCLIFGYKNYNKNHQIQRHLVEMISNLPYSFPDLPNGEHKASAKEKESDE